jgi:hypothetical protein
MVASRYSWVQLQRGEKSITVPRSTKDYLVVFSGATADTEAVEYYNFGSFTDVMNYEPNDIEETATLMTQY